MAESNKPIDVVIVNWNAGAQLSACVASVFEYADELVEAIIVVDNGSTDGSADSLNKAHPVQVIRAGSNLGFGRACNLGARHGHSEFICFLNPDARVLEQSLDSALRFMQRDDNAGVGVCSVQLVDEAGHVSRSCTRLPAARHLVAHALGIDRFLPRTGFFMTEWDHASDRRVAHVIGAFYFIRRSVFESLGGFDERFFVYLEDLDLSKRVQDSGMSIAFLAGAPAFHAGGGVSEQIKATRLFYSQRSRIQYAAKHFGKLRAVLVMLATVVLEPLSRSAYFLLRGAWQSVGETWSAQRRLWRWLLRSPNPEAP